MVCGALVLLAALLSLASAVSPSSEDTQGPSEAQPLGHEFEAALPPGKETDPFAIHHAAGIERIPNRSMVERLKGQLKIAPHSFEGIVQKRKVEGVFKVAHEKGWPPADAAGTGPFFLVKEAGRFFVLTERNLARVYGPIEKEEEVLPYIRVFSKLFFTRFGTLVMKKEGEREGDRIHYAAGSPEVTTVRKQPGGFDVRLVYYKILHQECFHAIHVFVHIDGTVKELGRKVLKVLGPGVRL